MKPLATSLSSTFKIRDLGSGFADTVDNTPSHSFLDNDRDQWIVDQIQARKSFVINNVQSSASWSRLAPLVTPKALFNHHHGVDDYTSLNKYNPATNDSTPIGARHALKLVSNSTGSYEAATPPVTFRDIGLREEVKAILKKIVPSMLYPRDEQFDAHSKSNHPPECILGYVSPGATWKCVGREFGRARCCIFVVHSSKTKHGHVERCSNQSFDAITLVLVDTSPNEDHFRDGFRKTYGCDPVERLSMIQPTEFAALCQRFQFMVLTVGQLAVIDAGRWWCAWDECGCQVTISWSQLPYESIPAAFFREEPLHQRATHRPDFSLEALMTGLVEWTLDASRTPNKHDIIQCCQAIGYIDALISESFVTELLHISVAPDAEGDQLGVAYRECDFCRNRLVASGWTCAHSCVAVGVSGPFDDEDDGGDDVNATKGGSTKRSSKKSVKRSKRRKRDAEVVPNEMKSADKVEICYRCFVDGRSCACGQMSLISLGTLVQLLRIRNGGTRFVQNLVRHGGIDQDVPEVSEVIKTGIVRKSELGQRPIREEHTMVTLAGVYLNKYRRRPLINVNCCAENCHNQQDRITITSHEAVECSCDSWVCFLCLGMQYGIHSTDFLVAYGGDQDRLSHLVDIIHAFHIGTGGLKHKLPVRFHAVAEAPTLCRPQLDRQSRVGFYDRHADEENQRISDQASSTTHSGEISVESAQPSGSSSRKRRRLVVKGPIRPSNDRRNVDE